MTCKEAFEVLRNEKPMTMPKTRLKELLWHLRNCPLCLLLAKTGCRQPETAQEKDESVKGAALAREIWREEAETN